MESMYINKIFIMQIYKLIIIIIIIIMILKIILKGNIFSYMVEK